VRFERSRYGNATKVLLQTTRDAFERRRARAFATDDTCLGAFWDAAGEQSHRAFSMLAFLGGGSASARLRNRVAQGAEYLLSALCWLGMAGVDVHAVRAATWEDDPWARGGYAYLDPGFDPVLRPYLARRAGRLVFAGEHTSARWQGYMNGAVESGIRAARELVES
jgi:monoamine oxidase